MVSMGFATVENIKYVLEGVQRGQGLQIGLQRMFLSVPAHATFAVVMGYFVGKAKFNERIRGRLMVAGIVGAVFFHGTFDFFLFIHQFSFWGHDISEALLAAGAIASFVVALILSRKLIRNQRNLSERMFKEKNTTITGV